jgi:hypothetical protein
LYRRLIRLIVDRKGGEGEIIGAFKSCAEGLVWSEEEGSKILIEIHHLEESSRLLKFTIIEALVDTMIERIANSDESKKNNSDQFIAQLVMAAIFLINDQDYDRMLSLFNRLSQGKPSRHYVCPPSTDFGSNSASTPTPIVLEASPAFVCSTYICRQGDKFYRDKLFELAAEWYLLSTHPVLRAIESTTWSKCFR